MASPGERRIVPESECDRLFDSLSALRASIGSIPSEYLRHAEEPPVAPPPRFDANRFFEVFDRVRLLPGYRLDYVYQFTAMGGNPLLYAREIDESPLSSAGEYCAKFPYASSNPPYRERLVFEKSPDGFFQFAVFSLEVTKFYLHWHSQYHDTQFICRARDLERVLAGIPSTESRFPGPISVSEESRGKLRARDLRPVVCLDGDDGVVTALTFTKWGGFKLSRAHLRWPNRYGKSESEAVVDYQCGMVF